MLHDDELLLWRKIISQKLCILLWVFHLYEKSHNFNKNSNFKIFSINENFLSIINIIAVSNGFSFLIWNHSRLCFSSQLCFTYHILPQGASKQTKALWYSFIIFCIRRLSNSDKNIFLCLYFTWNTNSTKLLWIFPLFKRKCT